MGKWMVFGLVGIFLAASIIVAAQLRGALAGQVIAAAASISVFALSFWLYFRKTKDQP
jgi:hypothetical protein